MNNDELQKEKLEIIKEKELECFNSDGRSLELIKDILETASFCEEPDYISKEFNYNIEEFEVSYSNTIKKDKEVGRINANAISRRHQKEIDDDLSNGEEVVVRTSENNNFSAAAFLENFTRITNKHYSKIENYKTNTSLGKVMFIVDIQPAISGVYYKQGRLTHELLKIFKTRELLELLEDYPEVDIWLFYNGACTIKREPTIVDNIRSRLFNTGEVEEFKGFFVTKEILEKNAIQDDEIIEYIRYLPLNNQSTVGARLNLH